MQETDAAASCKNVQRFLEATKIHIRHFAATEVRINRRIAQTFTPFEYIFFDENMSSRILCDLLSPVGKHGQGDTFLRSFLKYFALPLCFGGEYVHAKCEYYTHQGRRIDIVLHWQGNLLAIENKLWAGDQKQQLEDYLDEISKHDNYHLLYITPDGHGPEDYTLSPAARAKYAGKYNPVAWEKIIDWLMQMRKEVEAEKLRFFLEDFCNQLHNTLRLEINNG